VRCGASELLSAALSETVSIETVSRSTSMEVIARVGCRYISVDITGRVIVYRGRFRGRPRKLVFSIPAAMAVFFVTNPLALRIAAYIIFRLAPSRMRNRRTIRALLAALFNVLANGTEHTTRSMMSFVTRILGCADDEQ